MISTSFGRGLMSRVSPSFAETSARWSSAESVEMSGGSLPLCDLGVLPYPSSGWLLVSLPPKLEPPGDTENRKRSSG